MTPPVRRFDARSMLFVPGHRPERFDKAVASGADAICIDLEDAVPSGQKAEARTAALAYLQRRPADTLVFLRLNALGTVDGLRDLLALAEAPADADAVLLPKTQGPDEIRIASEVCGGRQRWIALVESALGLHRIDDIARQSPHLAALMFGGADFSADIGASFTWDALLHARQRIVCAAALARVPAIDVPFLEIADADGLAAEARRTIALGFACKAAIHPSQVGPIHAAFVPAAAEVERARRIVDAARKAGGGAFAVDGKMIDAPVLASAERVIALSRR